MPARTRLIKPTIITNEELCELGEHAYILFISLWMLADREGRLEDRPKRIKAEGMPFWNCDVDKLLTELEGHDFLRRYEVDGHRYIQILTFTKHQHVHPREGESTIPPPKNPVNSSNGAMRTDPGTPEADQGHAKDMPRTVLGNAKDMPRRVDSNSNSNSESDAVAACAATTRTRALFTARKPSAPNDSSSSSIDAALAKELWQVHPQRSSKRKAELVIGELHLNREQRDRMRESHQRYLAYYAREKPDFIPTLDRWVEDGDWLRPPPEKPISRAMQRMLEDPEAHVDLYKKFRGIPQ